MLLFSVKQTDTKKGSGHWGFEIRTDSSVEIYSWFSSAVPDLLISVCLVEGAWLCFTATHLPMIV